MVRTLFAVAAYRQPAVIFVDEVDSLLSARKEGENDASLRIKTEFLVQLDGTGVTQEAKEARVVIVGATNRPEELDEAARRRFVKRLYVPLPEDAGRLQLFRRLLGSVGSDSGDMPAHALSETDLQELVEQTKGFSGADVSSLCTEAAMGPVRELASACGGRLGDINAAEMPAIARCHFTEALEAVTPSVAPADLDRYIEWNATFGTFKRVE
jgi:SpoVK/Ycf46/Vps4 family AAA+-type ATPase